MEIVGWCLYVAFWCVVIALGGFLFAMLLASPFVLTRAVRRAVQEWARGRRTLVWAGLGAALACGVLGGAAGGLAYGPLTRGRTGRTGWKTAPK